MKNNIYLKDLDNDAKYILIAFLLSLSIGIGVGIAYIYYTTNSNPSGVIEHYKGDSSFEHQLENSNNLDELWDRPPKTEKFLHDMLETTHTHIISFSIISILLGLIFYFNSIITGRLKLFLIIEPFISTIITFSSLWIMRYLSDSFVYIVMISAGLLYPCWAMMIIISIYELLINKD